MNSPKRLFGVFLSLLLLTMPAMAQIGVSADFSAMYDDNINNNALKLEDRIGMLSLTAGYDWTTDNPSTRFFYTGTLSYFSRILDRTFHYHSLGLTHTRALGDSDTPPMLTLGGTYGTRVNRDYYSFYDHDQISLYGNLRFTVSNALMGKTGYIFRSLSFAELPDFNYTEHYAFGQVSTTLPTKTTIILQGDIGFKVYQTANPDTAVASGTMGGRNAVVVSSVPTVTQVIGMVRIGQSITDVTGLSVTGFYQSNIQKETRYLSSLDGLISDDEVFDDHYAYEGPHGNIMLTQLLGENFIVRASAGVQVKLYSDRPAFDLLGNVTAERREDTRRYVSFLTQAYIEALDLTISGQYDYITNSSNDLFYDYTNNAVTVSFSVPF